MKISIKREQNDACIGSAEREKFGTKFKNTMRSLSIAVLLVVGAIMTGCSSDDNIDNPLQSTNKDNVVTLTATVGFEANAGTRAVNPSTGVKTFEGTNQIAVIYKNTSNETVKAVSTIFTPTGDNTKATFTVTLTNPASGGAIRYIYPATMAKDVATGATITDDDATIDYTGLLSSQNGSLTTLGTNYDLAKFDGNLSGTDLPASATLTNPLAICKFILTDGISPITSSVTSLTISDGTNAYIVTPSAALSEFYVAMKPVTSSNISFTTTISTDTYCKTVSGKTLEASKLYPITVPMITKSTPLTLEAITAGTITVTSPQSGMQYSMDGGTTKTAVPDGTDIVVAVGDKVEFYGTANSYQGTKIGGEAQVKVYGNIMSLLNETGFASNTTLTVAYVFGDLFCGYTNLKDASGLLLPATKLYYYCYNSMFKGCTSLTAAPALPATDLTDATGCYGYMFEGCSSLTTAPELPAETLADECYMHMFNGCTSLTTAPELKATTLSFFCYINMFEGCTSLTATPELEATTLVMGCYSGMFKGCTNLTNAYVKAAYTNSECTEMFEGCTATGAVLHTTTANKASWEGAMGTGKTWTNWTANDDWN